MGTEVKLLKDNITKLLLNLNESKVDIYSLTETRETHAKRKYVFTSLESNK